MVGSYLTLFGGLYQHYHHGLTDLLLHEDALDELHGEGGLAHAAAAEHHDLVLTHVPNLRLRV